MGILKEKWATSPALLGECLHLEQMVPEMIRLGTICNLELRLHIHVMSHTTEQVRVITDLKISQEREVVGLFKMHVPDLCLTCTIFMPINVLTSVKLLLIFTSINKCRIRLGNSLTFVHLLVSIPN